MKRQSEQVAADSHSRIVTMVVSPLIKKLFSRAPESLAPLEIVERTRSRLESSSDLSETLPEIARNICIGLRADRCAVYLGLHSPTRMAAEHSPGFDNGCGAALRSLDLEIADKLSDDQVVEMKEDCLDLSFHRKQNGGPGGPDEKAQIERVLAAPIRVGSSTEGTIIAYWQNRSDASDESEMLIKTLASTLSLEMHRRALREKTEETREREDLTNLMLTAISTAIGIDETLRVAIVGLASRLSAARGAIFMRHTDETAGERPAFSARAVYDPNGALRPGYETRLRLPGDDLLDRLERGEIVELKERVESYKANGGKEDPSFSILAPISCKGCIIGVIALGFEGDSRLADEKLRLVRMVSEQTSVSLQQADLYREAHDAARREALISRITSALHRSLDPDTVLQAIVNELGAALSVCRCRLALLPGWMPDFVDITHEYLAPCCVDRIPSAYRIPVRDNPHLQSVFATDDPVAIYDVRDYERLAPSLDRLLAAGVKSLLAAAIRLAGQPIGFFALYHCEKYHAWTQWEIDIVRSVARQAAVAIRQAQLYREARESATQSALVNEIVAAIRHSLDLKETLQVAVDELGRALGASRVYFRKITPHHNEVIAEYVSNPELSIKEIPVKTGGFITRALLQTRRTLIFDDILRFIAEHADEAATVDLWRIESRNLSQIVCPIFVDGDLLGALIIGQTDKARKWTASEVALIEAVTAQIEVAVSHSQIFEEAKTAAQREALISHITHKINQSNRLDEIFPVVAGELGDHLRADRLVIIHFNQEARKLTLACEYRNGQITKPDQHYPINLFSNLKATVEDGLLVSDDVEADPRFESHLSTLLRPTQTRALLVAPLYYEGTPRFAIGAIMTRGPRRWREDEKYILREAADQAFVAFERAHLFEQVSLGKYEWEATFDALTDGIFIFNRKGMLTRVNAAGAAFEAALPAELLGRKCCSLMQGVEAEQCRVARVIETGRPVTFELMPAKLNRPVLVTISPLAGPPVSTDPRGKAMANGAVCIVRDLSELRAAEAAAREQRNFLVKLIEHATDAIFAISPEGRFIWFNEQLTKLSGYTREELKSGDYRKFFPPGESLRAMRRFLKALGGEAQTFEMQALSKAGDLRLLLVTYTPIYDVGSITSILCIARDVTEERLASERAARSDKLRALGQLASGVAHNFNNILAAILGHAQLIKRDCRDEHALGRLNIIERAAVDGAETVKRIQGFGHHQEGAITEMIDINQMVNDSTTLTQARWRDDAQARGINYQVEVSLQTVSFARGSASELREVFVNIILNALDAMPQGGKLSITTSASGPYVQIRFADTGKGMTRQVREHIFEPFFTTKGADGMGLGLAVSYSIVERHGGRIEVVSEPGRGSTFIITLPAAASHVREARRGIAHLIKAANILVIDDDDRVREAMAGMLEAAGHRTRQASDGREALEMMTRYRFDVVFTDLSMPGIDGWAVASEIRHRWPEVRIVLMTGFAVSPETMNDHLHLVDHAILKPVRYEEINSILGKIA